MTNSNFPKINVRNSVSECAQSKKKMRANIITMGLRTVLPQLLQPKSNKLVFLAN